MVQPSIQIEHSLAHVLRYFVRILKPESSYYWLTIIYGIGISVLSLATPISVQMLINTIANTGMAAPLVVLSVVLFVLLLLSGLLNAMRIHLMDLFARRFYSRLVADIALRAIYAVNPFFQDSKKVPLFNRYFDIIVVVNRIPNLLIGGFTILLQTVVGVILVSLYHPLFLLFSIVTVALAWSVWAIWGKPAMHSAMAKSHAKHEAAAWLEGLAASNGYFKSARHIDDALTRTDRETGHYIDKHIEHFRHYFSQNVAFLFLYAAMSATLLGLGGWLVIQGQLSLGQLVAAELVFSVVLYGLSQMGIYLGYFYDLIAAIDELSLFDQIEQEEPTADTTTDIRDGRVELVHARAVARGEDVEFHLALPSGARVLAQCENHGLQRMFTHLIKRNERPNSGYVAVGGIDIDAINLNTLRQRVIVLNRPTAVETTIRDYLRMCVDASDADRITSAIRAVDLEVTISQLEKGLDTALAVTGWPLSVNETMRLQLAAAILAEPRVLVLNALYDNMPGEALEHSLDLLQRKAGTTVIHFSNRSDIERGYTHYMYFQDSEQRAWTERESFIEHLRNAKALAEKSLHTLESPKNRMR